MSAPTSDVPAVLPPPAEGAMQRAAAPVAVVVMAIACAAALVLKAPPGLIAAAAACLSAGALALAWRMIRQLAAGHVATTERLDILAHLPAAAPAGAIPSPSDLEDAELSRLFAECQAELENRRSRPEPDESRRLLRQTAVLKNARLSAARAAAANRAEARALAPAKIKRT